MMKDIQVKVCGIRTAEQARMVLLLGVDYVGVNLWGETPRCVSIPEVGSVLEAVPAGKRVMVDVMPEEAKLAMAQALGFDWFQLHFPFDMEEAKLANWAERVGKERLWLAPKLPQGECFPEALLAYANTFVIDAYHKDAYGGTGKTADWARFFDLKQRYSDKRWILAGGLSPENIVDAVKESGASVVDINSGVESSPGVKDKSRVRELLTALKS